jgi:K+-transporting ATPase ATPase A chain
MLGTNGGGFFNANSAHPFENPTPLTNLFQIFLIFVIPAGLTYTLGRMTGSPGHGWAVLAAMFVLFAAGFTTVYWAESHPHPLIHGASCRLAPSPLPPATWRARRCATASQPSSLFATITTDASCGAVNTMHDSFTPLGGMVVLINIMMGEVVFGGVGSGLYGILIMVVLSVFIAGLMVGRTPEYLGKKIEAYDVKMSMLYVLIFPLIILSLHRRLRALAHHRPLQPEQPGAARLHRDSLRLHLGRGQQRLGLCRTQRQHLVVQRGAGLGPCWADGFLMMIPVLALAGNLASKKSVPPSPGTFPVNGALFTVLLVGVMVILSALTFFPALSLGPILEHLLLQGRTDSFVTAFPAVSKKRAWL